MASNINIRVNNATGEDQTFVLFQQDPSIHQIFTSVFPTAWRVFPVGATGGSANVILPIQYEIGAGQTTDAFTGTVSYMQNTDMGQQWTYSVDSSGFNQLVSTGKQTDSSIACTNLSGGYSSISLVKNGAPLLTYPMVGQNATATFQPISMIYVAWYNNIVEGSQIDAAISEPQALGINLTGATSVVATLSKISATGELVWSYTVNGVPGA
jgi:hypothetical protein